MNNVHYKRFFCRAAYKAGKSWPLILCAVMVFLFSWDHASVYASDASMASKILGVKPWEVGQFAIYQITSFDGGEGAGNGYKISIIGKENNGDKTYFWLQIDIYESLLLKDRVDVIKNITFQMLVPPVTTQEFSRNPEQYITNGFFPANAVRLKVQIYNNDFVEVDPKEYFTHQDLIEAMAYSITPEAMGEIDFSRMQLSEDPEKINVPAGTFLCDHIYVNTNMENAYYDEGFDLWRSQNIPLLGIVKINFSKTLYWEKWSHRNEGKTIGSFQDFLRYIYTKRVSGRRYPDDLIGALIDYGQK